MACYDTLDGVFTTIVSGLGKAAQWYSGKLSEEQGRIVSYVADSSAVKQGLRDAEAAETARIERERQTQELVERLGKIAVPVGVVIIGIMVGSRMGRKR